MLLYKITIASGLALRVVILVFKEGVGGGGGREVGHIIRNSQMCYLCPHRN